ncbi:hypothetical protein Tco_0088745 [Tanacetum coccineum]
MADLKFADTHNLVAFLSKPTESEGFEQIVDCLNSNPIIYALTINTTIYISCIEQFWSTVKAKTVNGELQLHALVDGKKIIITESAMRRDLQLEDAKGVDCLPNPTFFEQLTQMGYEKISQKLTFYKAFFSPQWKFMIHTILQYLSSKTTAWNDFSSTMASAIICLATNQKFNFSKYIFEGMVKNLDNVCKFFMYPRFIQVSLDEQLKGMPTHNRIYISPSHTKKVFRNMRRVGKGFSGRETPLFQTMVVQDQVEIGKGSANPTDPYYTPTFIQPSTSQPQKKQKPRKPKRNDTQIPQSSGPTEHVAYEAVYKELDDSLVRAATTASSLEAEQDSGNIAKTQSKATPNESSSLGTTSGGGPKCQETMGDTIAQTRFENVSKHSKDPLLARGGSGEQNKKFATKDLNLTVVMKVTLAQALAVLKSVKSKVKGDVIEEPSVLVSAISTKVNVVTTTTTTIISTTRKGIVVTELEERLAREKDEANVALTEEWDDIQAKVDVDYQFAQRLQAEEQDQFTTKQKAKLFKELLEQRRKHFTAKRSKEKRNKPPTKKLFDKAFKRVNMFVDYRTDLVEEIAEVDDDQEATKIKELMKIIPDEEEVAIDTIHLATKPPTIVDWKIYKEGKKNYYQFTDNSWKLVKKLNRINKTSGGL